MQIKVLYKNADGLDNEHSEASDSIKMQSFKTANYELTDQALGYLVGGGDASDQVHNHDTLYHRKAAFIDVSAGAADAAKPVKTNAAGKVDASMVDIPAINPLLDHGNLAGLGDDDHVQYVKADGTRDFSGVVKYSSIVTINDDKQLVHKKYVDDLVVGLESQSVKDIVTDAPSTPAIGDKYLVAASGATGTFAAKENQIAVYGSTGWTYIVPTVGLHVYVDDEPSNIYLWGGVSYSVKTYENTTASTGLVKVGSDIQVDSSIAGDALAFTSGVLDVKVDNSSLEISADALKVKNLGVKAPMIDFGTGANQVKASLIPVVDSGNYFPTDNVEAALQTLAQSILSVGVEYTVGAGGVVKGDPLYVSDYDTVSKYSAATTPRRVVGLALTDAVAGATVKSLANDTVLTGVLTGAVAGEPIYWNGTSYTNSIPNTAGAYVWKLGVAKNATDLHCEVEFVKRNSI